MLFNSLTFLVFFAGIYTLYLLLRNHHILQNRLLLAGSYLFYGFWDWRFLGLLAGITLVNYFAGQKIAASEDPKKRNRYLTLAIVICLLALGFFKYFNFFADSAVGLLGFFGLKADAVTLKIILPVGISFFTFQTLTYPLDIQRGRLKTTAPFWDFALFGSFFPQLLAGPIERAANMLPQFARPRTIDAGQVNAGVYLILWGYFKKVVIADNVALIANKVFDHYQAYQGLDIVIGVLAFAVQLYSDFSGYSDIARGLAKLMGFDLMVNFKLPYLATNPGDFWRRWHISLMSWFRDYLWWNLSKKIPMAGGLLAQVRWNLNLVFVFLVSGLWHGAAWNYVLWGGFHGLLLVGYGLYDRRRGEPAAAGRLTFLKKIASIAATFLLVMVGWVIFRATSVEQVWVMLTGIGPAVSAQTGQMAYQLFFFMFPLVAMHFLQQAKRDLLAPLGWPAWVRTPLYAALLVAIFVFSVRVATEFLYFQF